MPRLGPDSLPSPLPYHRARITPGIVHLGIGAFARAHLAAYVDALLADDPSWGIVGVSLRRPDTAMALNPQHGLYLLAERGGAGTSVRPIGSLLGVLDANAERADLLALMADPRIRIVSLTITEKGYCRDPASGGLDERHPGIVHDLARPEAPVSAPGLIVEALRRRRAAGIPSFTLLSCDNLPSNGRALRRVVCDFATLRDPALGDWVAAETAFPSTMVDRIVPATTDADRAEIARLSGVEDAWPVVTEPFSQFVVEDDFPTGRPDFGRAGVEMVADVEPFERMKLRLLNGAHTTLALLGQLAGQATIADSIAAPGFLAAIIRLHREAGETLPMPRADLDAYAARLIARFGNTALHHRTAQIATDSSQKLPQRLLAPMAERLADGHPVPALALGVAAFIAFAAGRDDDGEALVMNDPLAARLCDAAASAGRDPDRLFAAIAAIEAIFPPRLAADPGFAAAVLPLLRRLMADGAGRTLAALAET